MSCNDTCIVGTKKKSPVLTSTPQCVTPLPRRQAQLMKSLFTLQSPLNDSLFSPFSSQTTDNVKEGEQLTPSSAMNGKPCRKRTRKVLNEIINEKERIDEDSECTKKKLLSGCSTEGQRSGIEKQNVIKPDMEGQRSEAEKQGVIGSDVEGQRSGAANRIDGTHDAEQKMLSEDKGLMENGIIGEIVRYVRE